MEGQEKRERRFTHRHCWYHWGQRTGRVIQCYNVCAQCRILEYGGKAVRETPVFQRQGAKGGWQEGVAAKIHGHDPVAPVLHEVDGLQVGGAEAQAVIGEFVAEVGDP